MKMDVSVEILGQLMNHVAELIVLIDERQKEGWLRRHEHYKDRTHTHRNTHYLVDQYGFTLQEIEMWKGLTT